MKRRELLQFMATASVLPLVGALSPEDLLAAGRALRARDGFRVRHRFQALDHHEAEVVAMIAEMIIPETDTPGATEAGVPAFIDLIVGEWYDDEERSAFRAGIRDLDERARRAHGLDFGDAEPSARAALLEEMEEGRRRQQEAGRSRPTPFFVAMKHLTLWGYYTSEVGAIEELGYVTIPGQFNGCIPLLAPEER